MADRHGANKTVTAVLLALLALILAPNVIRGTGMASGDLGQALRAAVRSGDLAAVDDLVSRGAPLDSADENGRTALLLAVDGNHGAIARRLVQAGASINAQARNLDTPWLLAGAQGRTDILRDMIPAGPDLAIRNRFGGNALIPACERGHVETIVVLLTTAIDVNHVNRLGWTCLLEIVILGDGGPRHVEATRLVLAAGADPNLADKDGVTPLAHARARRQEAVARLIEQAGGRTTR